MSLLERITAFLKANKIRGYLVGGSVRDQLLARFDTQDLDISIEGDASRVARAFANEERGAFYLMDAEHNVARAILDSAHVDFASLRGTLEQDLATRDFTVNAMARSLDSGAIMDPFGGLNDLAARKIRALAATAFEHDPVRLLRAIRIAAQLGFLLEPQTQVWMRSAAEQLERASMERARDEFFKILALDSSPDLLRQMDGLGLLAHFLPEVTALKGVTQTAPHIYDAFEHSLRAVSDVVKIQSSAYGDVANGNYIPRLQQHFSESIVAERSRGLLLRLITLLHDVGKAETRSLGEDGRVHFIGHESRGALLAESIFRRLRLSKSEIEIGTHVIREHLRPPQLARSTVISSRAVYRFFRATGDEGVDVCVLALADTRAKGSGDTNPLTDERLPQVLTFLLDQYFGTPEIAIAPTPIIDGRALMEELQLAPGPEIGRLLELIREAQAAGEVKSRQEAVAYARHMTGQSAKHAEP